MWGPASVRQCVWRIAFFALLLAIPACESASTNTVGPSAAKCSVSATNSAGEIAASGGSATISVTTSRDCTWVATAQASWISLNPTTGQGPATLDYSVSPNPAGLARHSGVVVAQQAIDISQAAAPCRYQASPASVDLDPSARQISIAITATDACRWSARTDANWITIAAPTDGVGGGTVKVGVSSNGAENRTGTITIGTATVTINQAAPPPPTPPAPTPTPTPVPTPTPAPPPPPPPPPPPTCSYSLAQSTANIAAGAQDLTDSVAAPGGCSWSVSSDVAWITVAAGGNGTANGTFRLSIAANTGAERTGTVHVGTATLTVRQAAAACVDTIKPTWYDAGRGPDNISVSVTANSWCSWTVTTDATWVTIASGSTGIGNGTVRLSIPANTGPARKATVMIAGNAFALTQEAGCTATIKPTSYETGRGADTIKISVTSTADCPWTSSSPVSWAKIVAGTTGSGNGTVTVAIDANTGGPRSATLTIAGQPFALSQHGS